MENVGPQGSCAGDSIVASEFKARRVSRGATISTTHLSAFFRPRRNPNEICQAGRAYEDGREPSWRPDFQQLPPELN